MKRSFLMLAQKYDENKSRIAGWMASEKIDGVRAFYDGGITRGMKAVDVPWSNTAKDYRLKDEQICTGLWSRYGHVIYSPDWWLDSLPLFPLDGELASKSGWQDTSSIIKKHRNNMDSEAWKDVTYYVFDSPSLGTVFDDGNINEINYKKSFYRIDDWLKDQGVDVREPKMFEYSYNWLRDNIGWDTYSNCLLHEQIKLSKNENSAREQVEDMMDSVIEKKGEGLILRSSTNFWVPERSREMLKVKRYFDAEGVVKGYTAGIGKYEGLMGAVILEISGGKRLYLSGFTDAERVMNKPVCVKGGEELGLDYFNPLFPIGSTINFKFRELSDNEIPKEASYLRKR